MADPKKKPNPKDNKAKDKKPQPDIEIRADEDVMDDEVLEILESVEEDAPVVEGAVDDDDILEILEAVEEEESAAKSGKKPGGKNKPIADDEADLEVMEAVGADSDIAVTAESADIDDDEAVLVELASDVDLDQLTDDLEAAKPVSDVISEALESGIDLESGVKGKSAAAKSSSDSDIDLESILSEADESSAVDLGGSGKTRALPASDAMETLRQSDDAVEIGEEHLVRTPGVPRDDAVLVTPKDKGKSKSTEDVDLEAEIAAELQSLSDKRSSGDDDLAGIDLEEIVAAETDEPVEVEAEAPAFSPKGGKKGREPELVGAGAGPSKRRGGFMPFLMGLLLAVLLVGGGGAAAWYLNLLPRSPSAPPAPPKTVVQASPGGANEEELNNLKSEKEKAEKQLDELKKALEDAKIPAEPDKLQSHLNTLIAKQGGAPKIVTPDKSVEEILAKLKDASNQVAQLKEEKDAADKAIGALKQENAKIQSSITEQVKAATQAAQKEIDELGAKYLAAEKQIENLKANMAGLAKGDQADLLKQLNVAMEESKAAKKALEEARGQQDKLVAEAQNKANQDIAGLTQERDFVKKALDSAIEQQKTLSDSESAAKQKVDALLNDLAESSKAREALQAAFDTAKLELDKARAGGAAPAAAVTDVTIAESLIKQTDPKSKGQGYIILGASQARAGKSAEGLQNILKGLSMVDPQIALQQPEKTQVKSPSTVISKSLVVPPPVVVEAPNPLAADKFFTKGLELFWARSYLAAETQFLKAVYSFNDDARYHYYLGLSRYMQGSTEKRKQAHADFQQGVQLERSQQPSATEINASLERIQGELRTMLNGYRERQAGDSN